MRSTKNCGNLALQLTLRSSTGTCKTVLKGNECREGAPEVVQDAKPARCVHQPSQAPEAKTGSSFNGVSQASVRRSRA